LSIGHPALQQNQTPTILYQKLHNFIFPKSDVKSFDPNTLFIRPKMNIEIEKADQFGTLFKA
jgi:hypothetical protein